MSKNIQKLSIRLMKDSLSPEDGLRDGVTLDDWQAIEGGKIALGTMGGREPKWAKFLALSEVDKEKVYNWTAFGLVFVPVDGRWFAVSFGMGHVKLDPSKFVQDFGLKVVLNAVDPKQLKSADVRTPDENTLQRRSQTSRGSDQTAFAIDVERDIVRGLAGTPKDDTFAVRVAGTDSLSMDRKMDVGDLVAACSDAYAMYQKTDYQQDFRWIDQIKHEREKDVIEKLEDALISAIDNVVKGAVPDNLFLAFPIIYDPEKTAHIRYKGFRSNLIYPDLSFTNYLDAMKERSKAGYNRDDFDTHTVHEVDDQGKDCGGRWKISDCLVFEAEIDGKTYVLSAGRWYRIDEDLAKDVQDFFESAPKVSLPAAKAGENEEIYNARLKAEEADYLCLDRKLITPTGATSTIEVCDFLTKEKWFVHVKDKTSSSRLSHLFNQGTVSGRVLILDGQARDKIRAKIEEVEGETGQTGFMDVIPEAAADFQAPDYTMVFAVLSVGNVPKLPFFSLVTFRQAVRDLTTSGYKHAFAWVEKPAAEPKKKQTAAKSDEAENDNDSEDGEAAA